MEISEELLELLLLSLSDYLYRPVGEILYKSANAKSARVALRKIAKHHKLDATAYDCVKLNHRAIVSRWLLPRY